MPKEKIEIGKRSGNVESKDKLVSFLYVLMRDYVPCGQVEEIMIKQIADEWWPDTTTSFSNGWLANYAKDIATRLTSNCSLAETYYQRRKHGRTK